MKIIHTSDWHLGHSLYNYDRTEEQTAFLKQLCSIVKDEQPDVLLVCGDVYHTATPSANTQKMYTDGLLAIHQACPSMQIIVTAGNHDSCARLEIDCNLWQHFQVTVIGGISYLSDGSTNWNKHIIEIKNSKGNVIGFIGAVPHVYAHNFPSNKGLIPRQERQSAFFQHLLDEITERNTQNLPVILTAHLAVCESNCTDENMLVGGMDLVKQEELGIGYDYLALGHIHYPHLIHKTNPVTAYCGSPIAIDFDEDYAHSVYVLSLEKHKENPTIKKIEIHNPRPLTTLPKQPVNWDEALELLTEWPIDKKDYLRINIKAEQRFIPDMMEKITKLLEGKSSRFCYVKINREEKETPQKHHELSIEEFKQKSPIEVAKQYYEEREQTPMNEHLVQLLNQVWQQVNNDNETPLP